MVAGALKRTPLTPKIVLAIASPIVFLIISETVVRLSGVETDVARNENFDIAVPVWLLANENWVDIQRGRLEQPRGVRAVDVEWLQHFEEARYVEYKLKPNVRVSTVNPFNDIEVRRGITFRFESNSDGFRTKELEPKPPDVARIVTQGDSSTFGWGVHETYTYQRLLEDRLNRQPGNVEVLNLGMPGQTSRHGRAVFDHYARTLNPDLLIISFGANDARYVLEPAHVVLGRDEGWRGSVRQALMRFETFRLMRRLLVAVRDPFVASGERASAEGDRRELVNSVPIDAYKANLHYLIEQGRSIGAEAVLLSVCAPPQWSSAMGEVAEEAGVPLVDALELFRAHLDDLREHRLYSAEVRYAESIYGRQAMQENWRLYVTTDGCHPGLAGHSLIADALAESINSLDWR